MIPFSPMLLCFGDCNKINVRYTKSIDYNQNYKFNR